MLERIEHNARTEIDGPGDFDDQVDRVTPGQDGWIVGDHRNAASNPGRGLAGTADGFPRRDASFPERALGMLWRSIGHAGQAHPGNRSAELEGNRAAGRPCADDPNANRALLRLAQLQNAVDRGVERTDVPG